MNSKILTRIRHRRATDSKRELDCIIQILRPALDKAKLKPRKSAQNSPYILLLQIFTKKCLKESWFPKICLRNRMKTLRANQHKSLQDQKSQRAQNLGNNRLLGFWLKNWLLSRLRIVWPRFYHLQRCQSSLHSKLRKILSSLVKSWQIYRTITSALISIRRVIFSNLAKKNLKLVLWRPITLILTPTTQMKRWYMRSLLRMSDQEGTS